MYCIAYKFCCVCVCVEVVLFNLSACCTERLFAPSLSCGALGFQRATAVDEMSDSLCHQEMMSLRNLQ